MVEGQIGVAVATAYMFMTERKVSAKDEAVLLAVTLSHFLLEVPSHRQGKDSTLRVDFRKVVHTDSYIDVKITPTDSTHLGSGMFNYPVALFFTESALFLGALWVYTTFAPIATRVGYKRHEERLWGVVAFLIAQQAHFCFGTQVFFYKYAHRNESMTDMMFCRAPTMETRWVHAPTFLSEILLDSWLIGKLEA